MVMDESPEIDGMDEARRERLIQIFEEDRELFDALA
jgi:hypothetical protein